MTIERVESPERFAALGEEWDALYRDDPEAQIFLSRGWLADLHARRPGVCTLLWRESPEAAIGAALPLRRELVLDRARRRFRNELLMAGNHWADYTGVLCRPGAEPRALPALGAALLALPWERLRLHDLRIGPERLALLRTAIDPESHRVEAHAPRDNGGATRLDLAPRIALPSSVDAWLDTLGANTRQRLRRERRRLDADPALALRRSGAATRADDLAAFRRLWLGRWGEAKGGDAERKADKYVRILGDGLARGQLELTLVEADGEPVALSAVYDDPVHRTRAFYVGARDEAFGAVSAGLLLHAHAIEAAIGAGCRVYDFLRGDEPYKYALGASDETLAGFDVRPRPPTPAHAMLDPCHRDAALAAVDAARDSARPDTIGRLYSQLIESWPGEARVLGRYRAWLAETPGEGAGEAATAATSRARGTSRSRPRP